MEESDEESLDLYHMDPYISVLWNQDFLIGLLLSHNVFLPLPTKWFAFAREVCCLARSSVRFKMHRSGSGCLGTRVKAP